MRAAGRGFGSNHVRFANGLLWGPVERTERTTVESSLTAAVETGRNFEMKEIVSIAASELVSVAYSCEAGLQQAFEVVGADSDVHQLHCYIFVVDAEYSGNRESRSGSCSHTAENLLLALAMAGTAGNRSLAMLVATLMVLLKFDTEELSR